MINIGKYRNLDDLISFLESLECEFKLRHTCDEVVVYQNAEITSVAENDNFVYVDLQFGES